MNNILKKVFIIIILICLIIEFSSSYNSLNIDKLAFVSALGIDISQSNALKVSFQFAKSNSALSESSSSSEEENSVLVSVTSNTIDGAINLMNSYIGKQLNLSHCKLIVFSEELAQLGIYNEIYTLMNNVQIRPTTNIIISKTDSESYLKNSKPNLEKLITKYYDIFPNSSKYTGYIADATIGKFFSNLENPSAEPFAILGGTIESSKNNDSNINSNPDSIKSGETTFKGNRNSENLGLAIFKNDKLIGELTILETLCFLLINNHLDTFLISIPDPETPNETLDVQLYNESKIDKKVKIINNTPYINLSIKLTGRIASIKKDSDYTSTEILKKINNQTNSYLESIISTYLYKTAKDYKSDINSFGQIALNNFFTKSDFESFNWKKSYKSSFFNIDIDTNIKSSYLLRKT